MIPYYEDLYFNTNIRPHAFYCHLNARRVKRYHVAPHWHNCIELLYYLSGQAKVIINGKSHLACPGDLVIIKPHEIHSLNIDADERTQNYLIQFDPGILFSPDKTTFESTYLSAFITSDNTYPSILNHKHLKGTSIPEFIQDIVDEASNESIGFDMAVRLNLCKLFLHIIRLLHGKGLELTVGSDSATLESSITKIRSIIEYLCTNYQYDISVKEMSKMFNISYTYLSRQFKEVTGKTFCEFLNLIRLTQAERLLMTTNMSITDIALDCGFSSTSYFIKQFKIYKDKTPEQFRKKFIKK